MSGVQFKNVYKSYSKKHTFGNLNLDLSLNQIVNVVGPKKSGKTTLLNLLSGVESNFKGDIIIDEHLIDEHTKSLVSYCPSSLMFDMKFKIKDLLNLYKAIFDFDLDKTTKFLAENSININKRLGSLKLKDQYLVQLLLTLGRNAKIYLIDDLFLKLKGQELLDILEIIKEYSSRSLIILTSESCQVCESFASLFLFFEKGKLSKAISKYELHEKKSVDSFSWEVFSNV